MFCSVDCGLDILLEMFRAVQCSLQCSASAAREYLHNLCKITGGALAVNFQWRQDLGVVGGIWLTEGNIQYCVS